MPRLTGVMEKFVLHWGEMGTRWGINRTVAQIHALLYVSPKGLNAEEIAQTLGVARSNVSNSLRELQGWGIVKVVHVMGDRRDHFESMKDVWEMFRIILDERKKRECEPTLAMLRECAEAAGGKGGEADAYARERLTALRDFFETSTSLYEQLRRWPTSALLRLLKLGDRVRKFLGSER